MVNVSVFGGREEPISFSMWRANNGLTPRRGTNLGFSSSSTTAAGGEQGEGGRVLVPHYPTSTVVPPVPQALAEAMAEKTRREDLTSGLRLVALCRGTVVGTRG